MCGWVLVAIWILMVLGPVLRALFRVVEAPPEEQEFGPLRHEEGQCGVCRAPLGSAPVMCRKCRALHHRSCWTYAGRCPIYGCGGIWTESGN